ncbi:MAG: class I SAM-dependent methyltransferase [Clostridiales bacterium]|jgi:tRNA (adenine22-N1)-methyltransferase|nr:class I SAM-dependent methyltransferase [Clostridiales bacterium]
MLLSKRLESILKIINDIRMLADIGTDHGYIPVEACERGLADYAIATDISESALKKAQTLIKGRAMGDRVRTLTCNGFDRLESFNPDCAVVAGMGGLTIRDIIARDLSKSNVIKKLYKLILAPHRDVSSLRRELFSFNLNIADEELIYEDGFFYNLLICDNKPVREYSDEEFAFGKTLLQRKDLTLYKYLIHLLEKNNRILGEIPASSITRGEQLKRESDLAVRAIKRF